MANKETRRERLRELINQRFDGIARRFALAAKKPDGQINDMLAGRKSFGEKVARQIETTLGLPPLYFDQAEPVSCVREPEADYRIHSEPIAEVISIMQCLTNAEQLQVLGAVKAVSGGMMKTPRNPAERTGT